MGLADDVGYTQFLQVHGDQHRCRQVVANGDDGAVKIPHPQGTQHFLVLGVAHHSLSHIVRKLLHQAAVDIHSQHLRPQHAKLPGQGGAKPSQTDHNICFHKSQLLSNKQTGLSIAEPFLRPVSRQESKADGQHPYPAKIHI